VLEGIAAAARRESAIHGTSFRPEDDLRDSATRMRLLTLMRAAAIVRFGIDCKNFTHARGIPVRGAKWCPKAVRSDEWPLGLPSLGTSKRFMLKTKVLEANAMADSVAWWTRGLLERGQGFITENPRNGFLWDVPASRS
jgi:hypothetical protein